MSAIDCALVHHPVRDRAGAVVTTAVTNLDVHDIARSARTYGLGRYYVVTPIEAQHALVRRITEHWTEGAGRRRMPERHEALELCFPVHSLENAIADATQRHGRRPRLIATAARSSGPKRLTFQDARSLLHRDLDRVEPIKSASQGALPADGGRGLNRVEPIKTAPYNRVEPIKTAPYGPGDDVFMILFGTGHGLADIVLESADYVLAPIPGRAGYNHLSVRAAAAIIFDRLLGER